LLYNTRALYQQLRLPHAATNQGLQTIHNVELMDTLHDTNNIHNRILNNAVFETRSAREKTLRHRHVVRPQGSIIINTAAPRLAARMWAC